MNNRLHDLSLWQEAVAELGARKCYSTLILPEVRERTITQLLDGTYRFAPPHVAYIPKDDGSLRRLLIPSDDDRVVMSVLYHIYYPEATKHFHPSCTSYQKGMSTAVTAKRAQKHFGPGLKLDLSKYFDSVPRSVILEQLDKLYPDSGPTQCLKAYYSDDRIEVKGKLEPHFKSLCQGCAFSAILANMVLNDFDELMTNTAEFYARYSDDMLILDPRADELLPMVYDELSKHGLTLNPKKIQHINGGFDFLGIHIENDKLSIGAKGWRNLKQNVNATVKRLKTNVPIERYLQNARIAIMRTLNSQNAHTYGALAYYRNVCSTSDDFRRLDTYCRDTVRAHYTGKHNVTHNLHVLPNSKFAQALWVNFEYLYEKPTPVFNAYVRMLMYYRPKQKYMREIVDPDEFQNICLNLWQYAKYYKSGYFNMQQVPDGHFLTDASTEREAYKILCDYVASAYVPIGSKDYWYLGDSLYLFREMLT